MQHAVSLAAARGAIDARVASGLRELLDAGGP
jgi:hypothetical protein